MKEKGLHQILNDKKFREKLDKVKNKFKKTEG